MRRSIGSNLSAAAAILLILLAALALGSGGIAPSAPAWSQQAAKAKPGPADKPAPKQAPPLPKVQHGTKGLPRPVMDLREALLAAIEAGEIEELRHALDLSEAKPDLGAGPKADPIAHWKRISGDGAGREVLAALSLILDAGYVVLRAGPDLENNQVYVWPYFAEWPLQQLTPRQEVELLRLVPAAGLREMKAKGKYAGWRLKIGADGTWLELRRGD
jgi:hypothetical protein